MSRQRIACAATMHEKMFILTSQCLWIKKATEYPGIAGRLRIIER